jgi:uncharacterized pyridoxamine 5'-phosphate oxidase family protein
MTRNEVIKFIKEAHFGYLATIGSDNTPNVRPLGIDTIYGSDIYFFTFSTTGKVADIEANQYVQVVWAKLEELSQVRIKGKASIVKDEATQKKFREDNPMVAKLLSEATENLFLLYKIQPEKVEIAKGLVPYTEIAW